MLGVCLRCIAYLRVLFKNVEMTKAELCKKISAKTGCDAQTILAVVESLMVEVEGITGEGRECLSERLRQLYRKAACRKDYTKHFEEYHYYYTGS